MIEEVTQLKNEALELMRKEEYEEATEVLSKAISKADADSDDAAILLITCHLNRANCHLLLKKVDESLADADAVIDIHKKARSQNEKLDLSIDDEKQDPFTVPLSMAYVARGRTFEFRAKFVEALNEYTLANAILPNGDGAGATRRLLARLGLPDQDMGDEDIRLFTVLLLHLTSPSSVLTSISNLMSFVSSDAMTEEIAAKVAKTNCHRIIFVVMQLYPDNELIIGAALGCAVHLVIKGISDIWNGLPILLAIAKRWKDNLEIMGTMAILCQLAPIEMSHYMAKNGFIACFLSAIKLDLKDMELDSTFYALQLMCVNQEALEEIQKADIVDLILTRKLMSGLILLGKLCQLPPTAKKVVKSGIAILWATELINNPETDIVTIAGALMLIAHCLNYGCENSGSDLDQASKKQLKETAEKSFDFVLNLLSKHSKNAEIVSNAFAVLTFAIFYAPQRVAETHCLKAATTIMSVLSDSVPVCQNVIAFIYTYAIRGHIQDIVDSKTTLSSVISILRKHPSNQLIVERAVAIAVMCGHSNGPTMVKAAYKQFPESLILTQYKQVLNQ